MLILFSLVICLLSNVESLSSNLTEARRNLPEIVEGQRCVPGKMYKMFCNTCQCGDDNTLICTKMACIDEMTMEELKHKKEKHVLRRGMGLQLPPLPKEALCESGKLYKKGCQTCLCDDKMKLSCITKTCRAQLSSKPLNPDELIEAFQKQDLAMLPVRDSLASECQKGKSYQVDCNFCICRENGNLWCTFKLCYTMEGMAKAAAYVNSGKACDRGYEDKLICIKCDCVDGKTKCSAITGCAGFNILPLSAESTKLSLDLNKEKCKPKMVYSVHCNKCYCQRDLTLRCTQRICLNNSQSKQLKQQRLYLEKNGL